MTGTWDHDLYTPRLLEMLGGDDPWRQVYSLMRHEEGAPLFEMKLKKCPKCHELVGGQEKYNGTLTSLLNAMLEDDWELMA
jgi:hypothetical protein